MRQRRPLRLVVKSKTYRVQTLRALQRQAALHSAIAVRALWCNARSFAPYICHPNRCRHRQHCLAAKRATAVLLHPPLNFWMFFR
jgi:hypothetical protein